MSSGPSDSTVLLLSTSDTDLLAARASGADYRLANPARLDPAELAPLLDGSDVVVVRLLGGEQAWREGLAALRRQPLPLIVLGGEIIPDAALMALSSVPAGIAAQAHEYLAHGGPGNMRELAKFLADTSALAGHGFAPPEPMPTWGLRPWPPAETQPGAEAQSRAEAQPGADGQPGEPERPVVAVLLPGARTGRQHRLRRRPAPPRSRTAAHARCRSGAPACGPRRPGLAAGARPGRRPGRDRARGRGHGSGHVAGGRGRRGMGRGRDRRPGHPGRAGALPYLAKGAVDRGECRAQPARRGHPGGDPGVRRPDHQRAVLVQGDRRRRAVAVRPRSGTRRAGGRDRGRAGPAAAHPAGRAAGRDRAVRVPDQALPDRQRGRPGHPGEHRPAAASDARARLRRRARRRPRCAARHRATGRRRADPRGDRGRRPGPGVADRPAAGQRGGADPGRAVPRAGSAGCPPSCATRWSGPGGRRPASCTWTAAGAIPTATSCSPRCRRATWCCSSSRPAASARTRSRSTTTPTCRRATTTWPPTGG